MKFQFRFWTFLSISSFAACYPNDIRSPEPVWEVASGASNCDRACVGMTVLACPEGSPTERGTSCVAMCERLSASRVSSFKPDCAAKARSREQMRSCGVRCEE